MREIGNTYQLWPSSPENSSFKRNKDGSAFQLGLYKHIYGKFQAKVLTSSVPACTSEPDLTVQGDFRISYIDRSGNTIASALIGVLVYGMHDENIDGSASQGNGVYWYGASPMTESYQETLHGDRLSALGTSSSDIPQLSSDYQTVIIDYKALLQSYASVFPPPVGHSLGGAVIAGFDVYSHVQGGDIDFAVKDIDLTGED